jgi:hypothetical protein
MVHGKKERKKEKEKNNNNNKKKRSKNNKSPNVVVRYVGAEVEAILFKSFLP